MLDGFIYANAFKPHKNPLNGCHYLCFYRQKKQSAYRLKYLFKVAFLISGGIGSRQNTLLADCQMLSGASQVLVVKDPPVNARDTRDAGDTGSIPGSGRFPGVGNGNPLQPVFLPGKFRRQRSLVGYSPWGCKESDTTEPTHPHTHTHCFLGLTLLEHFLSA